MAAQARCRSCSSRLCRSENHRISSSTGQHRDHPAVEPQPAPGVSLCSPGFASFIPPQPHVSARGLVPCSVGPHSCMPSLSTLGLHCCPTACTSSAARGLPYHLGSKHPCFRHFCSLNTVIYTSPVACFRCTSSCGLRLKLQERCFGAFRLQPRVNIKISLRNIMSIAVVISALSWKWRPASAHGFRP